MTTVPAVPEGSYIDVGGDITMHYHDAGTAERGTVMFIHGSGPGASGWSNFKRNYAFLAERGYRTLVPDTFGYGYSTKVKEGEFSLADVAAQYKALATAAGVEKFSVVGNSQGGAIAIALALNFPESVQSLVLMAPGGIESRETYMDMEGIKAMLYTTFKLGLTPESMRELFKKQLHDESLITDEIIQERFQVSELQYKDNIARIKVKNQEDRLSEIDCPVLCFWGMNDKFCPSSGATKIASSCKNSRTVLISQCGHWVMVEYPKLFNETMLRFLNDELG